MTRLILTCMGDIWSPDICKDCPNKTKGCQPTALEVEELTIEELLNE